MSTADASRRILVTGATGLLGSHLVERLVARGDRVRALVRPSSVTGFLDERGVEVTRGDLTDPSACDRALDGVDVVYHCAAKVGDWGSWSEFQVGCIDATRTLAEAAVRRGSTDSSTSARRAPTATRATGRSRSTRTHPLGENIWLLDYYTRSKVDCERLLWGLAETDGLAPDGDPPELDLRRA